MNPALWTLLGLQLYSFLRFFLRSLQTVKGALLAGVGVLFLVPYLVLLVVSPAGTPAVDPDLIRQNGPPILLVYCLMQVVFNSTQSSLYFTPAEVQVLFSGPFTRREILLYKITLLTLLTLPVPLIFAAVFRQHAGSWPGAVLGMLFAIQFLTLFTVAVHLFIDTVGTVLYRRTRWVAALVLLVIVFGVLGGSGVLADLRAIEMQSGNLVRSPVVQAICWPVSWFFEVFLSPEFDGTFFAAIGMSLLVNYGMLLVVFTMDRNLLELAAANSERMYAMLQQMRRGQSAVAAGASGTSWSLPDFTYLGGVGPIVWRQMMLAVRGLGRLVTVLAIVGVVTLMGVIGTGESGRSGEAEGLLPMLVSMMVMMTVFMTLLVPFDFRGDLDNMALLKTLPISPWALVVGQLLTPTLVTTIFHWGLLAGVSMFGWQRGTPVDPRAVLALAVLFPLFNFMMFGVENLLFLLFPVRLTQTTPGDFQSLGRNILLTLGKMFLLFLVVGIAAVLGVVTYFFTGNNLLVALAASATVLFLGGVALIPIIVLAFARFDVGRDTPP